MRENNGNRQEYPNTLTFKICQSIRVDYWVKKKEHTESTVNYSNIGSYTK